MSKELALNTDAVTFAEAVGAALVMSVLAGVEWWYVVNLRAPQYMATWRDYVAVVLASWILLATSDRRSRFLLGGLIFVELGRVGATWLRFSDPTRRAICLWSTLTLAFLYSGAAVCLVNWIWQTIRTASVVDKHLPVEPAATGLGRRNQDR